MKILIVAGTPETSVENLCITFKADQTKFGIDPRVVIKRSVSDGHSVTLLSCGDAFHDVDVNKRIVVPDLTALCHYIQYLATNVDYDVVVNLVMLPWWHFTGVFTSVNDPRFGSITLQKCDARATTSLKWDPMLVFTRPDDNDEPLNEVMTGLRDGGCKAGIINLMSIEHTKTLPQEVISYCTKHAKDDGAFVWLLDDMDPRDDSRGVYVVGRFGSAAVTARYVSETIASTMNELHDITRGE